MDPFSIEPRRSTASVPGAQRTNPCPPFMPVRPSPTIAATTRGGCALFDSDGKTALYIVG
jgi:hypothetical protein